MDHPESNKQKIVLTINDEEMLFTDIENLKSYLQEELNSWKWLLEMRAFGPVSSELYIKFVKGQVALLLDTINKKTNLGDEFQIRDLNYPYIRSGSENWQLITRARQEQGNIAGMFLLIYLCHDVQGLIKKSSPIRDLVENGEYSYERAYALKLAMENIDFGSLICDTKMVSNEELTHRFSQKVSESVNTIEEFEKNIKLKLDHIKDAYEEQFSKVENNFKRRVERYKILSSTVKADSTKKLTDAQQDLKSAKDAYHDQVDLDASVQYWNNRLQTHTRAKYVWLLTVVCFMLITFFGLISYYGYGAVSGISKNFYSVSLPVVTIPQSQSANDPSKISPQVVIDTSISQAADNKLLLGRTTSELSLAMADLVGAALALALFGVLIRIGLRQFNSHSHCALDASERVTFVKTYLALLGEGKLKSDEDRRVILESLFRTSQPGVVSEIPFSSPIELILKTIGDKKP